MENLAGGVTRGKPWGSIPVLQAMGKLRGVQCAHLCSCVHAGSHVDSSASVHKLNSSHESGGTVCSLVLVAAKLHAYTYGYVHMDVYVCAHMSV